jgi:hypothetical protein
MTIGLRYFLCAIFSILAVVLLVWRPGPKWWIGVRLPWTFADRQIWDSSWVIAGGFCLALAVAVLFSTIAFYLTLALFFMVSMLYPMYCYRQKYGTLEFWKDVGWTGYRPVVRCSHCGHLQKLTDEAQLPAAICEACGLVCRSR